MDHEFIDENRVPEGFLRHSLDPSVRQSFVSHLLRCEECRDRVLLAQMFLDAEEAAAATPPVPHVQVPLAPEPEPPAPAFPRPAAQESLEEKPHIPSLSYVPKERLLRRLEAWQITWLFAFAVALLLVFASAAAVISLYTH